MDSKELQRIKQRYNIVGNCDGLNRALDIALQVAPTDLSVLIIGESGVGKEIIPRVIHDNSPRKREKYFAINCGSIPEGTTVSSLVTRKALSQEPLAKVKAILELPIKVLYSLMRLANFQWQHKHAYYVYSKQANTFVLEAQK